MIHYVKPFSTSKQIGEVYNKQCSIVPDGDFICCMDYDAMILTPATFQVIEKAIERYPNTAIWGAMCNRISYSHQRLLAEMDENDSIRHHTQIAIDLAEKYQDGESFEIKGGVAGFFMLFKKEYWEKNPFQDGIYDDRNNLFDWNFNRYAIKNKMPIRVIKGAYLFHSYRIMKESYKDTTHLRKFVNKNTSI